MAEDLSPSDIRARKFTAARRGLDRGEVASFLDDVAERVGTLEAELASLTTRLDQLGITNLVDLREEIEDVGLEIQNILDAAMAAAEGLRVRAAADAESTLGEADQSAYLLREDAWLAGTAALEDAAVHAGRTLAEAREDALFIRAQAEQDAKRLVTQAKREADDLLRSSREEGERIVVLAKAESESMLEEATSAAEKAQERARALENRRVELLNEMREAESSARERESVEADAGADADGTVRVIATGSDDRTHWPEDDGAVRILPSAIQPPEEPEPVDAEAMAAEVEMMRSAVVMPQPAEPEDDLEVDEAAGSGSDAETTEAIEADDETVPAATGIPDADSLDAAEEDAADPVVEEVVDEPEETSAPKQETDRVEQASEPSEAAVADKVTVVSGDPAIDDLFARLRSAAASEDAEDETSAEDAGPAAEVGRVGEPEPVAEAEPEPEPSAPPQLHVVPDIETSGDFDRRDRVLLPIENRGLRGLKRRIVELQNAVLEELRRSSGDWRLGREQVSGVMGEELDAVLTDSFKAGHTVAAETIGKPEPQPIGGPEQGAAEAFTADLHRDVQSVVEKGDPGSRRMAADVSRVFRNWRTDEAERHVRDAARRAFNDGLIAGYSRLGVDTIEVIAPGKPCGQCGAGTGIRWDPAEELPTGITIPPAGPKCAAMIMPILPTGSDSRSAE